MDWDKVTNIQGEVKGDKLRLTIDLTQEHGQSKSGKTITIASTRGNKEIVDGFFVGLNVYKYPESG